MWHKNKNNFKCFVFEISFAVDLFCVCLIYHLELI